jgi:hypothetical protein
MKKTFNRRSQQGFDMKINIFKPNTKRVMAITAIAVLSSTWTGAAFAAHIATEKTSGWVPNSVPVTRAAMKSRFLDAY